MRFERRHWEHLCAAPLSAASTSFSVLSAVEDEQILRELDEGGLASGVPGQEAGLSDRRNLYRFAADRELVVDVFRVPGGCLAAANLDLSGGTKFGSGTASGKGFDPARAVLSCLGEAVETSSWVYRRADRDKLVGFSDAGGRARLRPEGVLGFSASQIRQRARYNRLWDGWDTIPPARQMSRPDLWAAVDNFHGSNTAFCPAFLCYGGFGETACGDRTLNADSNGCAAGDSLLAAQCRAVLELAERDATGVWWWRQCARARICLSDDPDLDEALAEHAAESGRHVWFLDISTFRNAHVVAALSCDGNGRRVALGFAAAFAARDAVRQSFLEMIQTELALDAHEIRRARKQTMTGVDLRLAAWLREVDIAELDFLSGLDGEPSEILPQETGTLPGLIEEMSAAVGEDVWFADLSRPEFGVSVVKAICPGLAHFKPRWGCDRIWSLPGRRGWRVASGRRGLRSRPPLP